MPLERIITKANGNKVAIWHLKEELDELLGQITLSPEDQAKLESFRLDKRKREWVCARLLLQQLTQDYPGIAYTRNGKPYLTQAGAHISISHTAGYVAVSLSMSPTALDIEIVSPRVEKAASRFIHDAEWQFIPENKKTDFLTLIWCAKETLYKYFDEYGVVFKEHFRIDPFGSDVRGQMQAHCKYKNYDKKLILDFEITPNYTIVYHLNE